MTRTPVPKVRVPGLIAIGVTPPDSCTHPGHRMLLSRSQLVIDDRPGGVVEALREIVAGHVHIRGCRVMLTEDGALIEGLPPEEQP